MENKHELITRYRREFESFLPPNCFDVHAHLYRGRDAPVQPTHVTGDDGNVDWASWHRFAREWCGERAPTTGLFFAYPKAKIEFQLANRFVAEQVRDHVDCRALMLIGPGDDPTDVDSLVESVPFAGFKVYHLYAQRRDTMNCENSEFIPEWAWEIANARGLVITLHIVRDRALADPSNQEYIRTRCLKYPNARLILAHAARGFCAAHTIEGIASLRGLDNVFFDTSVVCESPAFSAIIREFGTSRIMYGSDFPMSEIRGRCVSIADSFLWLNEDNVPKGGSIPAPLTIVGIESLTALRQACREARLTDADLERIFRDNARELLRLGSTGDGGKTQQLYQRAKQLIPGGSQLLSKRPEMYAPQRWPAYFREARGCTVIDLDGREFCDMTTSGIGSCLLGYADPEVTDAVSRRVQLGSMSSLNSPEEVELAELLVSLHPWSEKVRFCRTGGESMAVAVRIARAATQRDAVAFCGYHGWSDWYLAANLAKPGAGSNAPEDHLAGHLLPGLSPTGVPSGLGETAYPFAYNRVEELSRIAEERGNRLAAVVMEPFRSAEPQPGFLAAVREICDRVGAVLIFDEITSGWRFGMGGIHLQFGVEPDIAVFAKAISNGFPMGAMLGRGAVMDSVQRTFVSSTYWTEAVGPAAALAAIRKMQRADVSTHVASIGAQLREGLLSLCNVHGVPLHISGRDALLHITFDHVQSAALGTLFTVRMIDRGLLAGNGFYPSLAHQSRHVTRYLEAANEVLPEIAAAIDQEDVLSRLDEGGVRHSGFSRLT